MRIDKPLCSFRNCRNCFDGNCIKSVEYDRCEYRHYEDLEEQGRLVVLPCKVGDTVYWINDWYRMYGDYKINEEKVYGFHIDAEGIVIDMDYGKLGTANKSVFLTKAEAEKALAEKALADIENKE